MVYKDKEKAKKYQKIWRKNNPDKLKSYSKKWRNANRQKQNQASANWRKNNPDYRHNYYIKKEREKERLCGICNKEIPTVIPRKYRRFGKICRSCWKNERRKYLKRRARKNRVIIKITQTLKKQAIIGYYSNGQFECSCCGFVDDNELLPFLVIDHIDGGGSKHLKRIGFSSMYNWLIRNNMPKGFQVLCHNCNMAKKMNNNVCPHQTTKNFSQMILT